MSSLVSNRGHFLTLRTTPPCPTVTVELYTKWYEFYVVYPDGSSIAVTFDRLGGFTEYSAYVDHVPNPAALMRWAKANDCEIDDLALELVLGRWLLEAWNELLNQEETLAKYEKYDGGT